MDNDKLELQYYPEERLNLYSPDNTLIGNVNACELMDFRIQIALLEDDMPSNKLFYDDKYSTNYTEVLINKLYNKE